MPDVPRRGLTMHLLTPLHSPKSSIWFSVTSLGHNLLSKIVPTLMEDTGFTGNFTNLFASFFGYEIVRCSDWRTTHYEQDRPLEYGWCLSVQNGLQQAQGNNVRCVERRLGGVKAKMPWCWRPTSNFCHVLLIETTVKLHEHSANNYYN